jgi:hypothetical protein
MAFVDITEDNISELMKSKDSKSTQRAVTQSIKLFQDFLIQKNEPEEFETYTKQNYHMLLGMGGAYERLVKINKCHLSNEMNG